MFTLCLDLGATYIKFAVFGEDGKILKQVRIPFPEFESVAGAERIVPFARVMESVRSGIEQIRAPSEKFKKIMVSTQMQGFVWVDRTSGQALGPFISWQDLRCRQTWDSLLQITTSEDLLVMGQELKPGHAVSSWLALNQKNEIPSAALPVSLGDAVIAELTRKIPAMHTSNASGFGCWNLRNQSWHQDFLSKLKLSSLSLPKVTNEVVPQIEGDIGTFYTCVGDQQAALLGAGLNDSNLSVNVATGSQVSCLTNQIELSPQFQTRPYFFGKYLKTVTHLPAGRAINFFMKHFATRPNQRVDEILSETDLSKIQRTDLKINLNVFPTSLGFGGSIENMREDNFNRENVLLAAFETMSSNYANVAQRIDPDHAKKSILASGGMLLKSDRLRKLVEEKMQRPLTPSAANEDALSGLYQLSL